MPEMFYSEVAVAARLSDDANDQGFPSATAWNVAPPVIFSADWLGNNADAERETQVRLLWTPEVLYLKFDARYRAIHVFSDSRPDGRRDQLWDRDVAEAFLQPQGTATFCYKEIEISPNGMWLDLDIAPGRKNDLQSGLKRRVTIDHLKKSWGAELALPMKSLTSRFDPQRTWRVNFYRVEGPQEPRFYSAWRPTGTTTPNFHVPASFGRLLFSEETPILRAR